MREEGGYSSASVSMMAPLVTAVGFTHRSASRTPGFRPKLNKGLDECSTRISTGSIRALEMEVPSLAAISGQQCVPAVVWWPLTMGTHHRRVRGEVDCHAGWLRCGTDRQLCMYQPRHERRPALFGLVGHFVIGPDMEDLGAHGLPLEHAVLEASEGQKRRRTTSNQEYQRYGKAPSHGLPNASLQPRRRP